jgi:hypothetical protein
MESFKWFALAWVCSVLLGLAAIYVTPPRIKEPNWFASIRGVEGCTALAWDWYPEPCGKWRAAHGTTDRAEIPASYETWRSDLFSSWRK